MAVGAAPPMAGFRRPRALRTVALSTPTWWAAALVATGGLALLARGLPVIAGAGLLGLHGYDDGVYFAAAIAMVHGAMPYRDFVLLQPPLNVLSLVPFAALTPLIGEPNAFAAARLAFAGLGAVNAVLVAAVAGRHDRQAGLLCGLIYAVWSTAVTAERTTDLHQVENGLLLAALLVLGRPGRVTVRAATLAGAAMGLATADHLWQGASAIVVLAWLLWTARDRLQGQLRVGAAFVTGGLLAGSLVCGAFLLVAGEAMVRQVLFDQAARPAIEFAVVPRVLDLAGILPWQVLAPGPRLVVAFGLGVGIALTLAAAALRVPQARLWVSLAAVQSAIVLLTPSYFADYASFAAPALALCIGTAIIEAARTLAGRRLHPALLGAPIVLAVALLLVYSLVRHRGSPVPYAALAPAASATGCVASNAPSLLVLLDRVGRDIDQGCPLIVDPTGLRYETDHGNLQSGPGGDSKRAAVGYQAAMATYYGSSSTALFVGAPHRDLAYSTIDLIRRRLPVERAVDGITILSPASP